MENNMNSEMKVKLLEKRIIVICDRCGPIGYTKTDEDGKEESFNILWNHMLKLETHKAISTVVEIEV